MAVILNASTSSGFVQSADTSGVITLQSNGTNAASVSGSNLQFNSGYGSVATAYGCRAWVNFNGTGTVAIRGSGNVTSITDNSAGNYTVNFTTAMPDVNYVASISSNNAVNIPSDINGTIATSSFNFSHFEGGASTDTSQLHIAIFR